MSGSYRYFWRDDRVRQVLSAQQRSVYAEILLHMEWRLTAYRLGNSKVAVPRGHTLFSLAGLARAAGVEVTLARKTIDRLVELKALEKTSTAQLPPCEELIPVGIAVLIPVEGIVAGKAATVVRVLQAEAFLSARDPEGRVAGTVVIGAAIGVGIGVNAETPNEPAQIEVPSRSSGSSRSSGGGTRAPSSPPDPTLLALWGQLQRLRAEAAPTAPPDPGVGRGGQPARLAATLATVAELVTQLGSPAELLEGYRSFLSDPWAAGLAPPFPLTAFAAQWARHARRSSPASSAAPAAIMCRTHPDRRALNPMAELCGACELELITARA